MKLMQNSMNIFQKWGIFTALFICGFFFLSSAVQASTYKTLPVTMSGSGELIMSPGEVKEVSATFLNNSDVTWYSDGAGYISLYTYEPKYRSSEFDPGTWLGPNQVKRIVESSVAPGEIASMKFELHAPSEEGSYNEIFHLASEDRAWIDGGEISFSIKVTSEIKNSVTIIEAEEEDGGLDAELSMQSANRIKVKAGSSILLTAGFKNIGLKSWSSYSLNEMDLALASSSVSFEHSSWSGTQLAYISDVVKTNEIAYITFAITAPDVNGDHIAEFQFSANGQSIEDVIVEFPIEVIGGSVAASNDNDDDKILQNYKVDEEPMLRVGILTVDEETDDIIIITSYKSDFELRDTEGNLLAELDKGDEVTAYFADSRYYFDFGRGLETSSYGLRFIPEEVNAVMTIVNFDYRLTRNGGYAYNTYRNILEIRHNDYKDRTWIINELSIETYLRGLAETSNISPSEYQKSLVTVARTYAYYHFYHGTKRGKEFMHVVAYADDQVYRGYERETMSPNVVSAVADTRGMVVTYDGSLAITPYFSRSDGRTRDWSDVWGGSIPWCQSVDVPWDDGNSLWGHGVGMSAVGALGMANDDYQWNEILKYFYTDIELERWWE